MIQDDNKSNKNDNNLDNNNQSIVKFKFLLFCDKKKHIQNCYLKSHNNVVFYIYSIQELKIEKEIE